MFSCQLCKVFWEHVELMIDKFGHVWQVRENLLQSCAEQSASALRENDSPLDSLVGFIDCTIIRTCHPGGASRNPRAVFSGHKCIHCLVYQKFTTSDGLTFSLHGPIERWRHVLTLLRRSRWENILAECLLLGDRQWYIFRDSAYVLRPWMIRLFAKEFATLDELSFNAVMSSRRVVVEHSCRDLKQYWCRQDYVRHLKVRAAPFGLLYKASAILLNFRTSLYRAGQTVHRFGLLPSTFDEYIRV